ncbi:MAG: C39 family peptidase, partial [Nitrospiria bacterium]
MKDPLDVLGWEPSPWIRGWAAALILSLIVLGCAGSVSRPLSPPGSGHRIAGVPFVPGEPGACGPAALSSVLAYWGSAVPVEAIGRAVAPSKSWSGVLPMDLAQFAGSRIATLRTETLVGSLDLLRAHVRLDHPLIAFLDLGTGIVRQGHFVVVVGFRDHPGEVLLYSGRDPEATMSYPRFVEAWTRGGSWALLLAPWATGAPPP